MSDGDDDDEPPPAATVTFKVYYYDGAGVSQANQSESIMATGCMVLEDGELVIENARTWLDSRIGEVVGELRVPHGKWSKVEFSSTQQLQTP